MVAGQSKLAGVVRRNVPWFSAGAVIGVLGTELVHLILSQREANERIEPPAPTTMTSPMILPSTVLESSPHYPVGAALPSLSNVVVRPSFTTSLNFGTKTPDWVAELLTSELVNGKSGEREKAQFKPDSDIPETFRATNEDYWDSGWSRGHLAASASHRHTQENQNATFLLNSNIVPQDLSMNGCDWNRLEVLVRDLTKSFPKGKVFVVSGPAWVAEDTVPVTQRPFSKNKVILHEVVGENQVHVPTHMWKVIRVEAQGVSGSVAFLMPNRPIPNEEPLESYKVPLVELERLTGLNFAGMQTRTDLCTQVKCNRTTNHRMLGWRHYGHIDEARTVEELRTTVRNAIDAGFVDGDNFLIPKIVRDRMRDLGLGNDVQKLFPGEPKYSEATARGLATFESRSKKD